MKNIRVVLSENFQFLVVKFSTYMKRRFVMDVLCHCGMSCVSSRIFVHVSAIVFVVSGCRQTSPRTYT